MFRRDRELLDRNVATIILAGGEGTRLKPLTEIRCKPAVMFGGRYRIIDVAISNAINAGFKDIFVISQFMASSLNNYLHETYSVDARQGTHVEIFSPEMTLDSRIWYNGTADAVRKNLEALERHPAEYCVILSGDQLYSMDLAEMLDFAKKTQADLVIATIPVNENEAKRMGVMKIDKSFAIKEFAEKPQEKETLMKFAIAPEIAAKRKSLDDLSFLGSMGIYIFKREALISLLKEDLREDFGKHLIPTQLQKGKTFAYIFNGYWEDIGTISSFFQANLSLTTNTRCLDLYSEKNPIYTQSITLPSPRVYDAQISQSIICDGSVVFADKVLRSMIGMRTEIADECTLSDTIIMGWVPHSNRPPVQIGKNSHLERVIVDEGVQIGDNVQLTNRQKHRDYSDSNIVVRDGIIIIKAGVHLPSNFVF